MPPRPQRELRDLTRYRSSVAADRARLINRIQKTLEDTNIKLASVATAITGTSARAIEDGSAGRGAEPPDPGRFGSQTDAREKRAAYSGSARNVERAPPLLIAEPGFASWTFLTNRSESWIKRLLTA